MDPNYKNFLAWKKSSRGQEFLIQQDQRELESIREQTSVNNIQNNINPPNEEAEFEINDEEFCLLAQENLQKNEENVGLVLNQHLTLNQAPNNNNIGNIGNIQRNNINFNFDTNKNKEKLNNNINNQNQSINRNNNSQFSNNNISNNNINNSVQNESKAYNLSFNKMYNAIKKTNTNTNANSNEAKVEKVQKKKRNVYFQLISKELIAIEPDFFLEPALMTLIKESQGRFDRESRLWFAPYKNYIELFTQLKNCSAMGDTSLFPITNLPIEVLSHINYTVLSFKTEEERIQVDYSKDRIHSVFELPSSMLTNLYGFQKTGIEFGIKMKGRMLLADEMGVGKTIQAIGISAVFQENWPVLILCPSSLKYNWRDEITNWLKDKVTHKQVQIIKSSKDEFKDSSKFFICSYEMSIRIHNKIAEKKFEFAIADEAHYLKSRDSKRSKLMVPVLQKCKRVLLLSGTPILAKPVEIYPLMQILRPDLFHSFKAFGSRYCDPKHTQFGVDWNGCANTRELHYILSNIMIRRLKKDVLSELPPKKRQKVEVQCDKKVLNQIKVLLNKSSGKIDIDNENLLSRIIDEEKKENDSDDVLSCFTKAYSLTGKAKLEGIVDYIAYLLQNDCKFLVFAHHMEVLNGIEEEVKKQKVKYVRIDGSINTEKRHILVHTFQNDDTCLVAVLGLTACATGLTLTKASTVVFAEMHFTPAIMIQAEDRAHRIGQEHNCVNVHYLYGAETVDDLIFPKLREKFFVVSSTLDNKRMEMDVQKIKSGCIGDFETKIKSEANQTQSEEGVKLVKFDNRNNNNISNGNYAKNLNTVGIGNGICKNFKDKSGKKNLTLTDFFKIKNQNNQNNIGDNVNVNNANISIVDPPVNKNDFDDFDEMVEGILKDEEFVKSLTNSEVKIPKKPENHEYKIDENSIINHLLYDNENEDSTDVTNINLHHTNAKRDRSMFDSNFNEFALLDCSANDILDLPNNSNNLNSENQNNQNNKIIDKKRKVEHKNPKEKKNK